MSHLVEVMAPALSPRALAAAAMRESYREWYSANRDPIPEQRLMWRAQLFRQLVHLLPGERILELGAGNGSFTRCLEVASRHENEIVSLGFKQTPRDAPPLPGAFDFVVGLDVLDRENAEELLALAFDSLAPGGEAVFFATNPGNPLLKARRAVLRGTGRKDPRNLLSRRELHAFTSAAGFTDAFSIFTDFLYAPLSRRGTRQLHDLSAILQNLRGVRRMSGAMVIHARKPGVRNRTAVSLADHASFSGEVSVVIPCHNEEMNVTPLVNRLRELYDPYIHEIILVDDNSTDSTLRVIESLSGNDSRIRAVKRRPPAGVGLAIADGYRSATGEYVLSLDADFQHLLPEVRDLFDAVAAGADVAVGSRFSPDSVLVNYPVQKIIANRGFHFLASIALGRKFRDVTNNLKLMRAEVASRLALSSSGFAVNAETGLAPIVLDYKVVEVPISWVGRDASMGASSFRLAAAGAGYFSALRKVRGMRRSSGK